MKFSIKIITFVFILLSALIIAADRQKEGCTTAVITGTASVDGAPLLWKNRDTGVLSNKVIFVAEKPYSYIALVNAKETSGRFAYAGLNSTGFAIMNSVAYNLPEGGAEELKDLEGLIMADALRTCRTVEDFEQAVKKNLGPALGSWANFGVIDGAGNAVIFEVHNNGYKKYDAAAAPEKYLVNTNFARSGAEGLGDGYLRFARAAALFREIPGKKVSHHYILQKISRDFGHPLLKHPTIEDLRQVSKREPVWIYARDCITRPHTAAAVFFCGKKPGNNESTATFWVILGEPATSIAVPLWVEAGETPLPLYEGETAPICAEALRIKKMIRPFHEPDKKSYMLLTRLVNKEKTGFLPLLLETEREIFAETAKFLKTSHTKDEYAVFQDKMAQQALQVLKKLK